MGTVAAYVTEVEQLQSRLNQRGGLKVSDAEDAEEVEDGTDASKKKRNRRARKKKTDATK